MPRNACWRTDHRPRVTSAGMLSRPRKERYKRPWYLKKLIFPTPTTSTRCATCCQPAGPSGWAVQAGYPGEWPEPSASDAVHAEAEARAVRDAVAAEFQRRGLLADGATK